MLIVLTLTAVPISFRWGGDLIVALTGTPPATPPGPGNATRAPEFAPPTAGAQPLSKDDLLKSAQTLMPEWKTLTLRLGGAALGGRSDGPRVEPFTVTVRERATWPRTATTTLTLNPYTGDVLRRSGYAELNPAQQVRSWTRFLHTGEALGWAGQLVAGIACLGGVFLVYTGFALSWRRFFGQRSSVETGAVETPKSSAIAESRR